jgi:glyoxylase-like metal-dependent hydrolase (beta-lactamase superfamily II)
VSTAERQERLPASEEVEEVAPGVLRIQIPIMLPGLGHVNCYVLEDDKGVTLIDPGLPDPVSNAALVGRLASAGIPVQRVHTVLVTHSHPDHFGGAGRLKVEHHCDVVAHDDFATPFDPQPVDVELTELATAHGDGPGAGGAGAVPAEAGPAEAAPDEAAPDEAALDEAALDEALGVGDLDLDDLGLGGRGAVNLRLAAVLFGTGDIPDIPARSTPYGEEGFRPGEGELEWMRSWDDLSKKGLLSLAPTTRVSDGQWLRLGRREWQALHTPGHTGDHLCLWDPERGVLLSGDHVLPTITPHISGLTPSEDALADFFAALHRVAGLPGVTKVLPAHGLPFDDLAGRVAAIVAHHDERLVRLEAIGEGLGTAGVRSYSRELFASRSWGPMAESETYAHLEHLRLLGRMRRSTDGAGKLCYTPVGG